MPIMYKKYITREFMRQHPDWLFVFGDNFERRGSGGQAKEMRGESNAVGIPTKRKPLDTLESYLSDSDLEEWEHETIAPGDRLYEHLDNDGIVVWPEDGIGTGLAQLKEKAPKIYQYLKCWQYDLECEYYLIEEEDVLSTHTPGSPDPNPAQGI